MKKSTLILLAAISATYLLSMFILGKNSNNDVLGVTKTPAITPEETAPSPSPSPSPDPTDSTPLTVSLSAQPTPSPSATLTPSPSAKPTEKPIPAPTAAPASEVNGFIDRFSAQYGVDPNVLRHIALCESGFRSNAVSVGYVGLFQFGPTTWKNIRKEFGEDPDLYLRYSPEESVQTAAYAFSRGKRGIWPNCAP